MVLLCILRGYHVASSRGAKVFIFDPANPKYKGSQYIFSIFTRLFLVGADPKEIINLPRLNRNASRPQFIAYRSTCISELDSPKQQSTQI